MTINPDVISPEAIDASERRRGLLLVAAAGLIWSSGGLIVRSIELADVWTIVFWRSAFAAVFLGGFVLFCHRRGTFGVFRRMGAPGVIVALGFASASIALVVALNLTSVADTLIILSTSPLVAALIGRIVLGEPVPARTSVAMAAAVVGVTIMVSGSFAHGSLTGDLVALIMPLGYAIAIVTIRRHRDVRMAPATCLSAVLAALLVLPLASPAAVTSLDLGLLFVFGAGQLGLGLALFVSGARWAPAAQVALISLIEPILGPLWVWLVLSEDPGMAALVGGAIVLGALIIHIALDLRRTRPRSLRKP